ncbi:MAG: hypothetical protein JXR84_14640 [Anaerolineae bacterium]|nr:hypothetical protein [Anaerolineae bacterium]
MDGFETLFDRLTKPGPRLPWLQEWLLDIWSAERYQQMDRLAYLEDGEKQVNELESVLAVAAPDLYNEFVSLPDDRHLLTFLQGEQPGAAVVFDGMSLRELPLALHLAGQSGRQVREMGVSFAALPSETNDFVEQRLAAGHNVGPSRLPTRRELKDQGIAAYYYGDINERQALSAGDRAMLLWSRFPDVVYADSGARFASHFEVIHAQFEPAWMNTVQQIPRERPVLVTSDHGYIFIKHTAPRARDELTMLSRRFGNERFYRLAEGEEPLEHPDVHVFPSRRLECLRGRVTTHSSGDTANLLYRHGGLSLMEMLTPWLVLA